MGMILILKSKSWFDFDFKSSIFSDFDFDFKSSEISMILILKRIQIKIILWHPTIIIIKLFHGIDETLIDYSLQDVNFVVTCNLQRTTKYL